VNVAKTKEMLVGKATLRMSNSTIDPSCSICEKSWEKFHQMHRVQHVGVHKKCSDVTGKLEETNCVWTMLKQQKRW